MNKAEFINCITLSTDMPVLEKEKMEEIINKFPYFQGAHLLLARSLFQTNDILFSESIKNAAFYSGNRKYLFGLFNKNTNRVAEGVNQPKQKEITDSSEPNFEYEKASSHLEEKEIISQIINYPEVKSFDEIEIQEKELEKINTPKPQSIVKSTSERDSFSGWLKKIKTEQQESEIRLLPSIVFPSQNKEKENNLIDRFIQTDPRISKPSKTEFFSPILMAKKSVEDNDNIVSETLANIYIDQGNTEKAILIFEKLSLLYPDKSPYFAALIKNLEKTDLL